VQRDRNHPSVIIYSAGNEIHDTPKPDIAKPILASLVETFHKYDPSRPVTQALFRPNVSHDYDNGLADMLDVVGQNYREKEILAAHELKPSRKILGTENTHDLAQWLAMRDNAPYSGQFLWAGIDYIGESIGGPTWDAPLACWIGRVRRARWAFSARAGGANVPWCTSPAARRRPRRAQPIPATLAPATSIS
jgi:beta-galactosidase